MEFFGVPKKAESGKPGGKVVGSFVRFDEEGSEKNSSLEPIQPFDSIEEDQITIRDYREVAKSLKGAIVALEEEHGVVSGTLKATADSRVMNRWSSATPLIVYEAGAGSVQIVGRASRFLATGGAEPIEWQIQIGGRKIRRSKSDTRSHKSLSATFKLMIDKTTQAVRANDIYRERVTKARSRMVMF